MNSLKSITDDLIKSGEMTEEQQGVVFAVIQLEMYKASIECLVAFKEINRDFITELDNLIKKYRELLGEGEKKIFDETVMAMGKKVSGTLAKITQDR